MQQELADRVGALDSTVSADAIKLKRWLNMAQQEITSRQNWPFMLYHEIIQTVPDTTTGTISLAVGSTALTFSSAPTVSVTDYFLKVEGDSNWYRITSHVASATAAVIEPAYGGATSLVASDYAIRKLFYATSTPLDSILDIKKTASGRFLESANARDADVFLPLYWDSGETYKYISSIPETGGGLRVSFLYSPSTIENYQVRGIKALADLSSDTDTSIIPARWHTTIIDLAGYYAFSSLNDTRASESFNKAEKGIMAMSETFDYDLNRLRVSRSLTTGLSEGPAYMLPPQYGMPQ